MTGKGRLFFAVCLVLAMLAGTMIRAGNLGPGSSGQAVLQLQRDLAYLGYLKCLPTSYYGAQTREAVRNFQRDNGLVADGIAGPKTLSTLAKRVREKEYTLSSRRNDVIGLVPWEEVNKLFPRGSTARVWDVKTRRSFMVWRFQGSFHADVEPLTRADTATFLEICGGRWSHARRAALVEIAGRLIAASMYPYPHGREGIGNNGFKGQFCLHFLGSRVHKSGRVDPTHQEQILAAANAYTLWERENSAVTSAIAEEAGVEAEPGQTPADSATPAPAAGIP